ncbi:MAG: protein arginine kinase [Turicibacter sp.]|nr:protein arginine kinase [Turicibacter sp.]
MTETPWYQHFSTDDGLVISSRVRLARNLKKYPFRTKLTTDMAKQVLEDVTTAVLDNRDSAWVKRLNLTSPAAHDEKSRNMLLEKHVISREFLKTKLPQGVLLQDDYNVSVMINEEDHLRIQTLSSGNDIQATWDVANRVDDAIEQNLEYAFDKNYGYLTTCPTNVGTGMRASYMIHLPMLERTGQLKNLMTAISKFGIAIRGLYGEGSEPMGCIYQISNQVTLGKSEHDIIQILQSVTKNIGDKESWLRAKMLERHRIDIENNIYRSYGILALSRKMAVKEAMDMLSEIRLGYAMEILDIPKPVKPLYQIMIEIQPGHITNYIGASSATELEMDIARAEYLRTMFT